MELESVRARSEPNPFRGRRVGTINNTACRRARQEATLRAARIHDLRHTFACRLRAAGAITEDREVLLDYARHSTAGHYASADVGHLIQQANLILNRGDTRTVLRVANGQKRWISNRARIAQLNIEGLGMSLVLDNGAPGEIRTPDRLVRSQVLYPAELRARIPLHFLFPIQRGARL
jgi:hypothetical protein